MAKTIGPVFCGLGGIAVIVVVIYFLVKGNPLGSYLDIVRNQVVNANKRGRRVIKMGAMNGGQINSSGTPISKDVESSHFAITHPPNTIIDNRLGSSLRPATLQEKAGKMGISMKKAHASRAKQPLGIDAERRFPPNHEALMERTVEPIVISEKTRGPDLLRPEVWAKTNAWTTVDGPGKANPMTSDGRFFNPN